MGRPLAGYWVIAASLRKAPMAVNGLRRKITTEIFQATSLPKYPLWSGDGKRGREKDGEGRSRSRDDPADRPCASMGEEGDSPAPIYLAQGAGGSQARGGAPGRASHSAS